MEAIDHLLAEVLAMKAVVAAVVSIHPDHERLRKCISEAAMGISATSFSGNQAAGVQAKFDSVIEHYLRLSTSDSSH